MTNTVCINKQKRNPKKQGERFEKNENKITAAKKAAVGLLIYATPFTELRSSMKAFVKVEPEVVETILISSFSENIE